jgi:DNA-binding MarR family transcriptional regulator
MEKPARKSRTRQNGARPVEQRIMAHLTRAMDWFDNSLQNVVASSGFQPVHRTQSMILMHIAMGVRAPSDIARAMGLTRQNVHHMAKELIDRNIIESTADPRDPRRSLYRMAENANANAMRRLALETMGELERVLETRIGAELVAQLRDAVTADWGPEVGSVSELRGGLAQAGIGKSRKSGARTKARS